MILIGYTNQNLVLFLVVYKIKLIGFYISYVDEILNNDF